MEYKIREVTVTAGKLMGEPAVALPKGSIVIKYEHQLKQTGMKGTEWEGFRLPERWNLTYLEPAGDNE